MKALARYYGVKLIIFDSQAYLGVRSHYSLYFLKNIAKLQLIFPFLLFLTPP